VLCELLGVSRSGYFKAKRRGPSAREREDARLAQKIATSHRRSRGTYGTPRIVEDLHEEARAYRPETLRAPDEGAGHPWAQEAPSQTAHHRQS
jgi:hypothetical protein